MFYKSMIAAAAVALLALPAAAVAATTTGDYGDVQVVNEGPPSNPTVFKLTSSQNNGYAGIYFGFTPTIALSSITQLSVDYQLTEGSFAVGSPRFTFFDSLDRAAYVYFGDTTDGGTYTDPLGGAYGNTGNYADLSSTVLRVQSNGFGGYNSGYPSITWQTFVDNAGSEGVAFITIDVEGGYANGPEGQVMLADNFTVNDDVLSATAAVAVPEPATWAMLIVGFGAAGSVIRRRRQPVAA